MIGLQPETGPGNASPVFGGGWWESRAKTPTTRASAS